RDQQALVRLAQWALRFSPLVEPMPPDTLLLDITGCQLLFGGEENIARQAVAGLARYGFQARAAIADTVGAAYALAAAGGTAIQIAPAGQLSACLAPLPPAVLRIEPRVVARLDALGVRSVGDLLMLPRASLPARFGARLVLRLQQALGEAPEPVSPYRPEEVPSAALPFEAPVTDGQAVAWAVERLLAELFTQLRRRELALRRLVCVLYGERIPPRVVTIGLARASRVPEHVGKLLHQRLESVDLAPGVTGLRLVARETSRWTAGQIGLFEPCTPDDDEASVAWWIASSGVWGMTRWCGRGCWMIISRRGRFGMYRWPRQVVRRRRVRRRRMRMFRPGRCAYLRGRCRFA
ncbi:MAG TPA: DNA polymerase Y family protein, partial [Phycisphaerae bacterium]|nr:DNA polymerase Y family protein [Phycisphaerae bacterium]